MQAGFEEKKGSTLRRPKFGPVTREPSDPRAPGRQMRSPSSLSSPCSHLKNTKRRKTWRPLSFPRAVPDPRPHARWPDRPPSPPSLAVDARQHQVAKKKAIDPVATFFSRSCCKYGGSSAPTMTPFLAGAAPPLVAASMAMVASTVSLAVEKPR